MAKLPEEIRFWANVDKTSDCWLWTGSTFRHGYGAFAMRDQQGRAGRASAHRYSYARFVAPIPDGFWVLHKCDTPACVRPDHLFVGTRQDNIDDMKKKGRNRGGGCFADKPPISTEVVAAIRDLRATGKTYREVAERCGVSQSTVGKVVLRQYRYARM